MYTNRKRSENDQYNETSNHRQMKGYGGSSGSPRPRGPKPCCCRRPLSFVYGLMSHCIDRFHFVSYLYTFHFYASNVYWTYISCYTFHIFIFYASFYTSYFQCFIYILLPLVFVIFHWFWFLKVPKNKIWPVDPSVLLVAEPFS